MGRLPSGRMLLQSVVVGGSGLYESAKAAMILIVVYTIISANVFLNDVNTYNQCETMFQCLLLALDAGINGDLSGMHGDDHGNIFDDFPKDVYTKSNRKSTLHWMVVISYFVIWNFIISGIIQGQIVDAFSTIRAELDEREADSKSRCLVCGLERFVLDELGGFEAHCAEEHCPLSYMYFIVYLHEKEADSYTGMETYAYRCLEENSNSWLPVGKCLKLQDEEIDNRKLVEKIDDRILPLVRR